MEKKWGYEVEERKELHKFIVYKKLICGPIKKRERPPVFFIVLY